MFTHVHTRAHTHTHTHTSHAHTSHAHTYTHTHTSHAHTYTHAHTQTPSLLYKYTHAPRYAFLSKFLKEVTTIFPEKNLFLGGDEVQGTCWSGSPTVKAWMDAHNMNSSDLGRYFWQQLTAQVLPGLNRTLGVWEDDQPQPHPDDLPAGSFGNIWQAQSTIKSAVDRKFNAVLSGPWYLDQQKPGGCSQYVVALLLIVFSDVSVNTKNAFRFIAHE
jgi:N-acetyl-beta-hexosaminidase